jgi:hypothetical protein
VGDFWKTVSKNRELRQLSRMNEQPSAYKGFFSKDGRYLAVVYEDDNSLSPLRYSFVRIYNLSPSDHTGRPRFDAKEYVDLELEVPTGRFQSIELSPNGNYGLLKFEGMGLLFQVNGFEFASRMVVADVTAICCTNECAAWQCNSCEHLHWWDYRGNHVGQVGGVFNGLQVSAFFPCPTNPSLLFYISVPEMDENEDEGGNEETREVLKYGTIKFRKRDGSTIFDTAIHHGPFTSRSRLSEAFLRDNEFDLEGRRPRLVWSADGSTVLYNHAHCIVPLAIGDDQIDPMLDPPSQLIHLLNTNYTYLHSKYDFVARFIIKGFELSPDLKALIVQIGDKSEDAGPDTFLLCPA